MRFKSLSKKILTFLVILNIFIACSLVKTEASYANGWGFKALKAKIHSMQQSISFQRHQNRKKIVELKRKEKIEIGKLSQSQSKLESTQSDIKSCQAKLASSQNKLSSLKSQLSSLSYEQDKSARLAAVRLRQIYKGERISMLHLIFEAKDSNSFLDRVYYQKRLAGYDKTLLNDLRAKARRVNMVKSSVESQQNNIVSTMNTMNQKKRQIASEISTSQYLINKLRTDRGTYEASERELASQSAALEAKLRRAMMSSHNKMDKVQIKAGFIKPLVGMITSPFGWRRHPIFGSRSFHTGVDIAASYGTPIHASNFGRVLYSGWYGGYGKVVIVSHGLYRGTGISTLYAHMSSIAASPGMVVQKGQVIGYEGTTGYSTGPHVHFEVRLNGKPTNPLQYAH